MRALKFALISLVLAVLAGCAADTANVFRNGVETQEIKFRVTGNPKTLEVDSDPNPKCNNKPEKRGCIVIDDNEFGIITFRLLQWNNWTFTRLQICAGGEKADVCVLTEEQAKEFYATFDGKVANLSTDGNIDLSDLSEDLGNFQLIDLNRFPGEYFYNVEVCEKADKTNCDWLDPPIINNGIGSLF